MVSVEEAIRIVQSKLYNPATIELSLEKAVGFVLREKIYADRDFPPFDRVMMDGIGISFQQFEEGQREFTVEDVQPAGMPQKVLANKHHCMEVMTGAVLPQGIDVVIRYEDVEIKNDIAHITIGKIDQGQHIHRQGMDVVKGAEIINSGTLLSSAEIALLASVGKSTVKVNQFPSVAIISTGDELVDVPEKPLPHQIRRSNSYALFAALHTIGIAVTLYHLVDHEKEIKKGLENILKEADVLILSGGVSKGKFDFIPQVLEQLEVEKHFHRVNQRPGKPFWFGTSKEGKTVFALPGNPVSTFMCFYQYVKPWLFESLGVERKSMTAILAKDFSFGPSVDYFLQVNLNVEKGCMMAYPHSGKGSGDFANLGEVDGFLHLPADKSEFKAGESYPYISFR